MLANVVLGAFWSDGGGTFVRGLAATVCEKQQTMFCGVIRRGLCPAADCNRPMIMVLREHRGSTEQQAVDGPRYVGVSEISFLRFFVVLSLTYHSGCVKSLGEVQRKRCFTPDLLRSSGISLVEPALSCRSEALPRYIRTLVLNSRF